MRPAERIRQVAQGMVNRVVVASDLNEAARLLDDCEDFIRGSTRSGVMYVRTPDRREDLLKRLGGERP